MNRRIILVVLDSVGVGGAPDAGRFGTIGSNTLGNVATRVNGLDCPHMARLGLGEIVPVLGCDEPGSFRGSYGALCEVSPAMDSITGHWELMGVRVEEPFPTYPEGFPPEVVEPYQRAIGREVLGNKHASGTEIIEEYCQRHRETRRPILYTSADSVFQLAAHEDVIPVEELYEFCRRARKMLTGPHAVGRVIARPFRGECGALERTARRKDFSVEPPRQTVMQDLEEAGYPVVAVGKITDIFAGVGVTQSIKTSSNREGMGAVLSCVKEGPEQGLVIANLVDFDMLYGHRNDPAGYAAALEEFDRHLGPMIEALSEGDVLILTADHGTDPTTESTDHSRELVPLLVTGPGVKHGVDLGVRAGFDEVGQTVLDYFDLSTRLEATSFLPEVVDSSG